jgi:hypothetical protein
MSLHHVMSSKNNCASERSLAGVDGFHLALQSHSFSQSLSGNVDAEHFFVLGGFISSSVHQCSAIGSEAISYRADVLGNREDSLVSSTDHHFVDNDFLSS